MFTSTRPVFQRAQHKTARLLSTLLVGFGLCAALAAPAHAATFTVNTVADTNDGACTGLDTGNGCTLREAIVAANSVPADADTIGFNIPGAPANGIANVIDVLSPLPEVTGQNTTINGESEPDFSGAGHPVIVLKGNLAGAGTTGLVLRGSGHEVIGLVVNNFSSAGIRIEGNGGTGFNHGDYINVRRCFIGTNALGDGAFGNGAIGVLIFKADQCLIAESLVTGSPIQIQIGGTVDNKAENDQVFASKIGTNAAGTAILAPAGSTGGAGVWLSTGSSGAYLNGNVINDAFTPVLVSGTNENPSGSHQIERNKIGTNAAGTAGLGFINGIEIGDAGAAQVKNNLISDGQNPNSIGVLVSNTGSSDLKANMIGTDVSGNNAIPNGTGVEFRNSTGGNGVAHGGVGPNRIAFNRGDGILITPGANNTPGSRGVFIGDNQIFSNGGLGINLQPAGEAAGTVTPNDAGDADNGPNGLQNFPVITSVVESGGNTVINGTLNSRDNDPNAGGNGVYDLNFYRNDSADPSGYGEGQQFLGSTRVNLDASGNVTFSFSATGTFAAGSVFAATATDSYTAGTSEFSRAVPVSVVAEPPKLALVIRPGIFSEAAGARAATATVARTGSTTAALTVTLLNSTPSKVSIPASIIIPAGAARVTFFVAALNNNVADGPLRVGISARSAGYTSISSGVTVLDDEARLALSISPAIFSENAGARAAVGTLARNTTTTKPLTIKLASGDTSELTVPLFVTIPTGASSVNFTVSAVDDTVADGPVRVGIAARASGFSTVSTGVTVLDNEARLFLRTSRPSFSEASGSGAAVGTVSRNTPTTAALSVKLVSSDITEARVPVSVVIPAGAGSVTFPISAVNDTIVDGPQAVILTASATTLGYTSGTASVTVLDDEVAARSAATAPGLSSATAQSDSVRLTFSGALDVNAATDATRYSVQVNGVTVEVQSVSIKNSSVLLGLPEGALHAGDALNVAYDLLDGAGRSVSGQSGPLTAR